eukprot:82915-Heterocapsa_arctica.AAC.1
MVSASSRPCGVPSPRRWGECRARWAPPWLVALSHEVGEWLRLRLGQDDASWPGTRSSHGRRRED